MRLPSKKIIAFAFLLMVALPVFLSLKFILEENLIEQEMEEKMNSGKLQSISMARADIIWVKAGKEILFAGKLFDVKNIESNNDTITLTGFFDEKETALMEELEEYTNNNNNPFTKSALKFLFSPVFNSYHEIVFETGWVAVSNKYSLFTETLPAAPCISFTHPPKVYMSFFS